MSALPTTLIADGPSDIRHLSTSPWADPTRYSKPITVNRGSLSPITRNRTSSCSMLYFVMPGELDGFQMLDTIRSGPQLKQTPVIMVTGRVRRVITKTA